MNNMQLTQSSIAQSQMFNESVSKTVYSLVYPETRALMHEALSEHTNEMIARHDAPHLRTQDAYGPDFARDWWRWAGFEHADQWAHFYPTCGASEALRELINELTRTNGTLVVLEGEYEGYQAIAQGNGTHVLVLRREHWQEDWQQISAHLTTPTQVWLSNPSSIDGNFWPDFDLFCHTVQHPLVELWVDLTYIGASTPSKHQHLSINLQHITGCVFSLSKPAGMYYRRVGGCFSARPIAGLYGNQWFKNLDSMFLGQLFMSRFARGALPEKYHQLQQHVVDHINAWTQLDAPLWKQSDVFLLAHAHEYPFCHSTHEPNPFKRGSVYRVCLTPTLHKMIYDQA